MPPAGTGPRPTEAFTHVVQAIGDVVTEVLGRSHLAGRGAADGAQGLLRLSDAERDDAAEILRDAYAEGRLDLGEFEERLALVHAARVHADLPPLLADLPGGASGPTGQVPPDEIVTAVLREVRRDGIWEVPPHLRVQARGGTVVLDLRAARVRSPVVEIDVRVTAGRVVIIVPDGIPVELRDGLTLFGNRRDQLTGRSGAARSGFGSGRSGRSGRSGPSGSGRSGPARPGPARGGREPAGREPAEPVTRLVVGGEILGGQLVVRSPTVRERWRGV